MITSLSIRFENEGLIQADETCKIKVFVKSEESTKVDVTLSINGGKVKFFEVKNGKCKENNEKSATKSVDVPAGKEVYESFYVFLLDHGEFELNAEGKIRNDKKKAIKKVKTFTEAAAAKMFDLRNQNFDSFHFSNENFVGLSCKVTGNLMGEKLNINDNFFKKSLNFMPGVFPYAISYLTNIGEVNYDKENALNAIKIFYNEFISKVALQEWYMTGFSNNIESAAFAAKFLSASKSQIEIDASFIGAAIDFMSRKQKINGHFGGETVDDQADLTAFVVISFLENSDTKHDKNIQKALKFIVDNVDEIELDHTLAISAYALSFKDKENSKRFLEKLESKSENDDGKVFWRNIGDKSNEIKTAAYAILAYSRLEKPAKACGIMKWLADEQNFANFTTVVDSMIAYQAAAEMAKHFYSKTVDLILTFSTDKETKIIKINESDRNQQQMVKFDGKEGISINAEGHGIAFVECVKTEKFKGKAFEAESEEDALILKGIVDLGIEHPGTVDPGNVGEKKQGNSTGNENEPTDEDDEVNEPENSDWSSKTKKLLIIISVAVGAIAVLAAVIVFL